MPGAVGVCLPIVAIQTQCETSTTKLTRYPVPPDKPDVTPALVFAHPRNDVHRARVLAQRSSRFAERLVAYAVPVGGVDLFEVVDIEEQNGDGPRAALASSPVARPGGRPA